MQSCHLEIRIYLAHILESSLSNALCKEPDVNYKLFHCTYHAFAIGLPADICSLLGRVLTSSPCIRVSSPDPPVDLSVGDLPATILWMYLSLAVHLLCFLNLRLLSSAYIPSSAVSLKKKLRGLHTNYLYW